MGQGWRTAPMPRGWAVTRRRILRRDAGMCYLDGRPGATEVDHVVSVANGGSEEDSNLAAIHTECHRRKTGREARAAQPNRRREPESHPGLVKTKTTPHR